LEIPAGDASVVRARPHALVLLVILLLANAPVEADGVTMAYEV